MDYGKIDGLSVQWEGPWAAAQALVTGSRISMQRLTLSNYSVLDWLALLCTCYKVPIQVYQLVKRYKSEAKAEIDTLDMNGYDLNVMTKLSAQNCSA